MWHAGEPLTLPCRWYDEATEILRRSLREWQAEAMEFTQHVQTNATLINDEWCDCFRRNRIVVGISVDGPEDIHDANRRFRNGRGSHALALRGIEALHRKRCSVPLHRGDHRGGDGAARADVSLLPRPRQSTAWASTSRSRRG